VWRVIDPSGANGTVNTPAAPTLPASHDYSPAGAGSLGATRTGRHHADLAQVVTGQISTLPGVIETRTRITFKSYSRHDLNAVWSLCTDQSGRDQPTEDIRRQLFGRSSRLAVRESTNHSLQAATGPPHRR